MGYNDYDERGRMYQEDDDNHPGMYDDIDLDFAVPGSNSALRATRNQGGRCGSCRGKVGMRDHYCKHCAASLNPRVNPCGLCGRKDLLTDDDVKKEYVCDGCADARERGGYCYGEY